jgi:hypothetical protein
MRVTLRNVPGSAVTRVSIDGKDAFGFDPNREAFVGFEGGRAIAADPDLPPSQVRALRRALVQHSIDRDLAFEKMHLDALRRGDPRR